MHACKPHVKAGPKALEPKSGGWGFILGDDWGRVLKAGAGREEFLEDAFHAELLGLLAGLKEALTWAWGEQRLRLMQLW